MLLEIRNNNFELNHTITQSLSLKKRNWSRSEPGTTTRTVEYQGLSPFKNGNAFSAKGSDTVVLPVLNTVGGDNAVS